ncbi:hypothetical protein LTR62_000677 [Meristemomyces frigidus]|uniref:Meiotic sister chromatid recombination protein 1 n=1 Tax=Meristemomyces frigidus TaxID=1508187 RepID=A0AAN7TA57_9PEZI|nr:hypothetical protein LTR62_000677 [Meristemomyces frigidus]
MRFLSLALAAFAATATANTKLAYNKWHETELERWLSDHNVPYPTPADRKNLQDLVSKNWDDNVQKPYNSWDTNQLGNYIKSQGYEVQKGTEKNKDSLLSQVASYWHGTADSANDAYHSVSSWIFDSWTESQLKSFLDYHNIPNPSPRTRDSLLSTVRSNYASAAEKAGETAHYPGNWIYQSWSDSDLKQWLDERGVPVPQPSSRDKLIASLRRNAKAASDQAKGSASTMSASASSAQQSLSDQLIDAWSDSQLKEFFDKHGIKVPQGSKRNEMVALARKNYASFSGDNVVSSASSYMGAATSSAGNTFAQASGDAYGSFRNYYDYFANQIGFASAEAKVSIQSAASYASASASSLASAGSASASSFSSAASSSASSLSSAASKSASSASSVASKSGKNPASAASSAMSEVSASASASASSLSKVAASSSSSASSVASKSSSSLSSVAGSSSSSASSVASKSSSSGSSVASNSASSASSKASASARSAKNEL